MGQCSVEPGNPRPRHQQQSPGVAYAPRWAYAEGGDLFSFPTIRSNFNGKHPISDDRLGVTADLFNLLDMRNLGCFDETFGFNNGQLNPNYRHAGCVISDPRRFQLGRQYDF